MPKPKRRYITGYYSHRNVWARAHGPIPLKHHIHHIDNDPQNNDLANLECLPASVHRSEHSQEPERRAQSRINIEKARIAALEWHRSPEGRELRGKTTYLVWQNRLPVPCVCRVCGSAFQSKKSHARVCSGKCEAKARRDSGKDDIDYTCSECSAVFRDNKHKKRIYCSRRCSKTAYHKRRRALASIIGDQEDGCDPHKTIT